MTAAMTESGVVQASEAAATKPNGPVAAGFIAAGVGTFVIGLGVVANQASTAIKSAIGFDVNAFLKFDANFGLGKGVGPLSGKVTLGVLFFLATWLFLGYLWRDKEVPFGRAFAISLALVGLGFLLTFPPIFDIFTSS